MSIAEKLINEWAQKKYGSRITSKTCITFEMADRGSGCPTCGYTDIKVTVEADGREIDELDCSISTLLNEILGAEK